ncbi:hypothetical protein RDI58_014034 [Solanum bulbocastanum]|uniref:Uncharacterized protein n=1 Tax=Solanum bulbocastanum TaxID=147425 RepID=A0AAN8TNV8_SOLBU
MRSAEEVVDELISSSLVIPFDNSICKIHDLVHDFCSIKSRKEKFFNVIGGSNTPSSSSSDRMPRGIIIRYDKYLFDLDENFVPFDPKMKNPYGKHLLSLKVYDGLPLVLDLISGVISRKEKKEAFYPKDKNIWISE